MSFWLDFLGSEISFVDTPDYGRIRVAQAGPKDAPKILFQHGIGGHLEAYCKNVVALSDQFHCIAFDYVGHGLSTRQQREYTPLVLADQVIQLMDAMHIERAHLSGESLGAWVSGFIAVNHPQRVDKLMLNTGAGLPIVSQKGLDDLANLARLSKANADKAPTFDSVKSRIEWLIHPDNFNLITDELVHTRLGYYSTDEARTVAPMVNKMLARHDDFLIPLEQIKHDTMLLWTRDNPIHDLECARAAHERIAGSELYIMDADACHWPQYEAPTEFNRVARRFFAS